MKFLIVGSGPTGLGAACRIHDFIKSHPEQNVQVKIIERESIPGGLSRTVYDSHGFGWDCGGHITFSAYKYYNEILDRAVEQWKLHKREAYIDLRSRSGFGPDALYPYPVQKSVPHFPEDIRDKCIEDVRQLWKEKEERVTNGETKKPETFEEFCMLGFGRTLCDVFFKPYNEKIWTTPFAQLSSEWVSERVATIELKDVEAKPIQQKEEKDHGWGPNAVFRYPVNGGCGHIWGSVSKLIPPEWFSFETELVGVDLEKKSAKLRKAGDHQGNVEEYQYDYLINTMPLDLFGRLCSNPKLELHLAHTSVVIVGVAVEDQIPESIADKSWLYFPDDSPYYRVAFLSKYFNDCTPDNRKFYSLLCEIPMVPREHNERVDLDDIARRSVQRLIKQGYIRSEEKVHHTHQFLLPYGYPIPNMSRNAELRKAQQILEANAVYSRGRFGGWKYEVANQDHSFMQGAEAAGRILENAQETVYKFK